MIKKITYFTHNLPSFYMIVDSPHPTIRRYTPWGGPSFIRSNRVVITQIRWPCKSAREMYKWSNGHSVTSWTITFGHKGPPSFSAGFVPRTSVWIFGIRLEFSRVVGKTNAAGRQCSHLHPIPTLTSSRISASSLNVKIDKPMHIGTLIITDHIYTA